MSSGRKIQRFPAANVRVIFRNGETSYTVSDGERVLTLEALGAEDGGGCGVTSPMEPQLVTEADTIEEAFAMARDAIAALRHLDQFGDWPRCANPAS